MIARLDIELPYSITLNRGVTYDEFHYDLAGYHITIYPPLESPIPDSNAKPEILTINGRDTFHSNHLRIDFAAETFSRLKEPNKIDPDSVLISEVVNDLLSKLRFISRAHRIQSIDFPNLDWTIAYLNDDGTQIPATTSEYSLIGAKKHHVRVSAITPEMWTNFRTLDPSFVAPLWSTLLSEALVVLPNVGASLVLTATALEVFIASTLDALADIALNNSPLWTWINNRNQRSSNPNPEEQFSKLLEILGSRSLTTDNSLWQSYQTLRKARNSFAHGGVAKLGVAPVTEQQAREFIDTAWRITIFVRDHIPDQIRWPHYVYEVNFTYSKAQRLGTGQPRN